MLSNTRVLGTTTVNELRFGYNMQRERRFARAFRAIDFDDPALGQAANAERDIEPQRAG